MHSGIDRKCVDGEDVNIEGVMIRLLEVHISRKDGPCPIGMLCHEVRSTRLRYSLNLLLPQLSKAVEHFFHFHYFCGKCREGRRY